MLTITFYAYKGGTGRTLALANAAVYLSRLQQKVFAIDLDLESPGLHHKLALSHVGSHTPIDRGIVDCIHTFVTEHRIPDKLAPYTVQVPREEERDGPITLMPAGNVLSSKYWRQLARLNWHELFYSEEAQGIPFFLELKERIKAEFSPDFLLIDARTGITEVGGVATTLLPDRVVCLLMNNRENLEGAREVLRGLKRVSTRREQAIEITPVLSRIPVAPRTSEMMPEQQLINSVRDFLCEPSKATNEALDLPGLFVLHSEESLAYEEALRIGGKRTLDESPLLRDYLHLFAQIIPSGQVEPHLDRLIEAAATKDMLLENPDRVQSDLEALAVYCPHPASYLALLKFYRLRGASSLLLLQTAVRYWEVSHRSDQALLRAIVREHYRPERAPVGERIPHLLTFVRAVWESTPDRDPSIGMRIVDQALSERRRDLALHVIREILTGVDEQPELVVGCVNRIIRARDFDMARSLIQQYSTKLAENSDFQIARARLIVAIESSVEARALVGNPTFRPASILAKAPQIYLQLLQLAGRKEEFEAALQDSFERAIASQSFEDLFSLGRMFAELGRSEVFRRRIEESLPKPRAKRLFEMMSRGVQRSLFEGVGDDIPF